MSEALDQTNRKFQLAHVLALVSCSDLLDELIARPEHCPTRPCAVPGRTGQLFCGLLS